jgi:small subunit ribosomal protein S9
MPDPYYWGTGRRKTAVARVRLRVGSGKIVVNGRPFEQYFPTIGMRQHALEPLEALGMRTHWDVWATVQGGGVVGQAGAFRLGVARALREAAPDRVRDLKQHGFLSRDPRRKERKKYGLHGARRGTQWTKR